MNKHLVILDPGLSELGGHHPATLESIKIALCQQTTVEQWSASSSELNQTRPNLADIRLTVFCNQHCSDAFVQQQQNQQVVCIPHFTTAYYRYFYQNPSAKELTEYTLLLAKEYQQALLTVLTNPENDGPILFWCHTLNWEHAAALVLALGLVSKQVSSEQYARFQVNVGLMYHPLSRMPQQGLQQQKHMMRYELAFHRLMMCQKVRLFAADQEIQQYYKIKFGKNIPIQPCLLLGSTNHLTKGSINEGEMQKAKGLDERPILLFTGDAKENKGFNQLPALIQKMVRAYPEHQFVVQYSNYQNTPQLIAIDQTIRHLAQQYSNLKRIDCYLSHQDLMCLFQSSQAVVFNYDQVTYKYQSSGVLWLAAFFNLRVISLSETWLSREASRLSMVYCEAGSTKDCAPLLALQPDEVLKDKKKNKYFEELFIDVADWLHIQFKELT